LFTGVWNETSIINHNHLNLNLIEKQFCKDLFKHILHSDYFSISKYL